jgi:hypothetical protein
MPVNEVGMHVARRNGIRCASHGDEASHPLIALERGDRGDAGRVHVAPRAALARMTYRARRLRLGGRYAVRLKEIRALMRGRFAKRRDGRVGQRPRLRERDVACPALRIHEVRRRAMLMACDAQTRALPLHRHECRIATLRVTAPAIQRRIDPEIRLPVVLDMREAQVRRLSPRAIPFDACNVAPIVAAGALLDARVAVVRAFLEYAHVASDARWKEALVFRVRKASLIAARERESRRGPRECENDGRPEAPPHESSSGSPGSRPIVHSMRSEARV